MVSPASDLPAEVFGIPLSPGPVPQSLRLQLDRRRRDRFCPFLMSKCTQPYPVCSVLEAGTAVPVCPHRLLEGQAVFRSLTPFLPGPRARVLRNVRPTDGKGFLGWVLFDARHPDQWMGVLTMVPFPSPLEALRWALHDVFRHGRLDPGGYPLSFDWPASARDAGGWLAHVAEWGRTWRRPLYGFLPEPLAEHLAAAPEGWPADPLTLVPLRLEPQAVGGWQLRLPPPPAPAQEPPERGGMWRSILRRWGDWVSLEVLATIRPDPSGP